MPKFTLIDLIGSLAALNKGDVEGFRQPWSAEGRQQRVTERGLRTQELGQQQALMSWFQGLQPQDLPPALAQRLSAVQTRSAEQLQPLALPTAQAGLEATRTGTERERAQTDAMRAVQPFLASQAEANKASTVAGTAAQTAQTVAFNELQAAMKQPGFQELFQRVLGVPTETQVPLTAFSAVEPSVRAGQAVEQRTSESQLQALSSILPSLGFMSPGDIPALLQRIGELTKAGIGKKSSTPTGPYAQTFQGWQGQAAPTTKKPSTARAAGRSLVSGEGLSNAFVNAATGPMSRYIQQQAQTPNVQELLIPERAIPKNVTSDELRQAMELLRLLTSGNTISQ